MTTTPIGRYLGIAEVKAQTSLSKTTIWRRVKDETFPPPVALGGRRRGWLEQEIEVWKRDRLATRKPPD